jgi:hypothetical protein
MEREKIIIEDRISLLQLEQTLNIYLDVLGLDFIQVKSIKKSIALISKYNYILGSLENNNYIKNIKE